jgi:hypothetical protein
MKHARIAGAATALLSAAVVTLVAPVPASADPHPLHGGLVSADPANNTPNVLDGHVDAFAQVGDTMIVGGQFTQVEQGGTVFDRDNVFAFSISTGHVSSDFVPQVNDEVFDLQLTPGAQNVILGGGFSSVDGAPKTGKVAEVSVADGGVVAGFVSPMPNGLVRDIVAANGYYYIGGAFTTFGGHPRDYLAALQPNGSDSGTVALDFTGTNNGGSTNVRSIDVDSGGTRLVVAGNFASVNGHPRGQLALVDISSAGSSLSPWATTRYSPICGPHFDGYMRDVAFAPTGDFFVVVATGGPHGFQKSGLMCDSASRWDVSSDPDAEPAWIDYTGGDTLTAAIVDANAVYIGGHERWLNNSYGHNSPQRGAVGREGIAALDPVNGLPYTWNPGRRRGYGVFGFGLTDDGLWVGSDTKGFGGEVRQRIAFCPAVGGTDVPSYATASLPGHLATLESGGGVDVRSFDGHAVGPAGTISSNQWTGLRGSFVVDQTLYTGWEDGTMTAQPFDGTTLGAATSVDLHDGFRDLDQVQAMFFDSATHRIYYSHRGSDKLYYRYFQPESRVVGSWAFQAPAGTVQWSRVAGAFLIHHRLFFTNAQNGNLKRVGWNAASGQSTGSTVNLLGPAIDGNDYRAAGLVAVP